MVSIKQLYELQELDTASATHEKSLADVQARLADDSAVVSARKRLQDLEARLTDRSAKRRLVDGSLEQLRQKLSTLEARLYSGAVRDARGLSASQEEREYILSQQREGEDELLELMVDIEETQAGQQETSEILARLEAEREVEVVTLREEEKRLAALLAKLGQARPQAAQRIPSQVLSLYEGLRKSRGGSAVSKVERGLCQGCRVALPTKDIQRARASEAVAQCSSCGRILYAV